MDALAPMPGYVEPVRRPTVVVFIAPGSLAHWDEIEAQIRDGTEAVPFEEDVEIALEVLPGFNVPSSMHSGKCPVTTSCHPKYESPITLVPSLGASIGPHLSDADSGSLGAVVNFQPRGGGEPQKCFLTAYHVIASGDPIDRAANDEFGTGLDGRKVTWRIEIAYPAPCDGEYTNECIAKHATGDTKFRESNCEDLAAFIENEGVIGEIIHASGPRHNSVGDRRCRIDWALVALHPHKVAVLNTAPTKFTGLQVRYNGSSTDVIFGTGEPVAFSWAAKNTSGIWGTVNGMKRTVCWGDGVIPKEVEVIPSHGRFAEGGDDGSMVFNLNKEWVGMVIGGDSVYAGYITPAADIIADIKARTGGTITLI